MTTTGTTMTTTGTMTMTTTERRRRATVRSSFRVRVLGSFVLLMLGLIATGLVIQRTVLLREMDREVDLDLERVRAEVEALAQGNDPETGRPFGGDVASIFETFLDRNIPAEDGVFVTFVLGAPHRTTRSPIRLDRDPGLVARWGMLTEGERGSIATSAGPVEYLAVPLADEAGPRGVFVAAMFTGPRRAEIDRSLRVEAVVSLSVLVVAAGVAWFVAGRLLRPVRHLTETAEAITDSDLSGRIPVAGDDEISRLACTFNEMLDRLERAFTAQRRFVDDAGHELRTPITIIRGHLEVMGDDPDERRETLDLVGDELDRMGRIVEDLMVLAKSDQPDFVQPQTVELVDLTTELFAKSQALGPRAWEMEGAAEGTIEADAQRLTQAVLNLARNAVEHTAPGARIGIGSAWSGDELRLWVRDSGPGIDPGEHERIFDRFARGRSGRRSSDGAGLGLSIVRSVAVAHGGRVELDSVPGEGATFTVVLPGGSPDESTPDPVELDPTDDPTPDPVDPDPPDDPSPDDPTRIASNDDPTQELPSWPGS